MMMMMMITALNIVDVRARVFLDKKQGWCHIIVIVVPHGATRMVKTAKGKVEKYQDLRRKVARLRNVIAGFQCHAI